jgi:DNA-binding CsgD family transcriptional regulator
MAHDSELQKELSLLRGKCAFLEKVIHEVPASIYLSDLEKGVIWCNKTNEEALGYKLEEILQMGGMQYLAKVVHPEDQHIPSDSVSHYQHFSGAEFGGVFRARHKEKTEYKWFVGWAKAFAKDASGEVKSLICVDVDLSPRMDTENQVIAALKENLKLKNQLLLKNLRKRELEVLTQLSKGLSTKAIAKNLNISVLTVQTHRRNIQKKLGSANIAEMVFFANQAGLG